MSSLFPSFSVSSSARYSSLTVTFVIRLLLLSFFLYIHPLLLPLCLFSLSHPFPSLIPFLLRSFFLHSAKFLPISTSFPPLLPFLCITFPLIMQGSASLLPFIALTFSPSVPTSPHPHPHFHSPRYLNDPTNHESRLPSPSPSSLPPPATLTTPAPSPETVPLPPLQYTTAVPFNLSVQRRGKRSLTFCFWSCSIQLTAPEGMDWPPR